MYIDECPLVSVFILCYNHEKYVAESIESVINQTYKNIEIIIVDNASIDNSRTIIESYVMKDNRIKFFPMEYNSFVSAGCNFGIKQCSGEYICGLSADDFFELNKIEIQLEYMLSNKLSNTFTWVKVVNDDNEELFGHWIEGLFNRVFLSNEVEKIFITQGNTICAITWMFHKSMFEKYGYFDHRLLQTQDFDLWLRIIKNEKINIMTQKLACYRVRDDGNNLSINMDHKASIRSWFEATYYIRHILDFDLGLLSEAIGKVCNEENKYINLFEYYRTNNLVPYAVAVVYSMYEKLGPDFKFPSSVYSDFFSIYSTYDFMNASGNSFFNLETQLFFSRNENFTEKESIKFSISNIDSMKEFIFDLSNLESLKNLRLDPLNEVCIVEIEKITLITLNNDFLDIQEYIDSNAFFSQEKIYFFDHDDPQFYFTNLKNINLNDVKELRVLIRYLHIGKNAYSECVKKKNEIIDEQNHKLESIKLKNIIKKLVGISK